MRKSWPRVARALRAPGQRSQHARCRSPLTYQPSLPLASAHVSLQLTGFAPGPSHAPGPRAFRQGLVPRRGPSPQPCLCPGSRLWTPLPPTDSRRAGARAGQLSLATVLFQIFSNPPRVCCPFLLPVPPEGLTCFLRPRLCQQPPHRLPWVPSSAVSAGFRSVLSPAAYKQPEAQPGASSCGQGLLVSASRPEAGRQVACSPRARLPADVTGWMGHT